METLSHEAALSAIDATWLAALRFDDPELSAVETRLPSAFVEQARRLRADVSRLAPGDKARRVRLVVESMHAALPQAPPLPARALGLLCAEVGRDTGRRWAAASPAPRRGFVASAALRRWLARLARASAE